jgi:peptidoglycan-associated lipoprotein
MSTLMQKLSRSGLVLVVALSMGLAACKKPPQAPPAAPPPAPPAAQPPPSQPPAPPAPRPTPVPPPVAENRMLSEEEVFARMSLGELNEKSPLVDVYFAYDLAELSDSTRATLQKAADWLRRFTSTKVMVEGHADSRGTNEYNLALGERRANSVRDYLVSLGIPAARFTIVSKGEEDPVCREEADSCYEKNRRAHFVFTGK